MKQWLEEKREKYLHRILQMKAGPQDLLGKGGKSVVLRCPKCDFGRPIWRCLDCTDKSAVCVLCCRNAHKFNIFHTIEKWNGRFYQTGALWQVGVKVYTGHNGHPCPKSTAALSVLGPKTYPAANPNEPADKLSEVAEVFGISQLEVLEIISESLEAKSMTRLQKDVLGSMAEKSGVGVLDLLEHLKEALSNKAEEDAEALQTESDRATANAEQTPQTDDMSEPQVVIDIMEENMGGDEDWEDEDERPAKGDMPRFLPRPPPTDGTGNPFITIVHTNGFHSLPVVWCACSENLEDRDMQLLDLHFYPASYDRIKTVFTFDCLNQHRYEALECKSSHYQYHNKLRRLTCPSYPGLAPNRYTELSRVARQWRNLKHRKWFWLRDNLNAKRGSMALFCAACPQPGVNLEANWQEEQDRNPYVGSV